MSVVKKQIVHAALQGIDRAIKRLWEPRGTATHYDPGAMLGQPTPLTHPDMRPHGTYNLYAMGLDDYQRTDPPWMWPEVIELTESFIGAALVIAQEHIAEAPLDDTHRDICHLANYWKHRSTWGNLWQNAHKKTKAGILAIHGGTFPSRPPIEVGVLTDLTKIVLKMPFSGHDLWMAIQHVP